MRHAIPLSILIAIIVLSATLAGCAQTARNSNDSNDKFNHPPNVSLWSNVTTGIAPFYPELYYTCWDPDGNLKSCELMADGAVVAAGTPEAPMALDSSNWPRFNTAGNHTLSIKGTDKAGLVSVTDVIFVVSLRKIPYPTRDLSAQDQKLVWPLDCELGVDCSMNYPDIDGNNWSVCGSTYQGHTGSDIGAYSWEWMDRGVDVYAAADGVVQFAVDGRYDRCVISGPNATTDIPDCMEPPADAFGPDLVSGHRTCSGLGDYCQAETKRQYGSVPCEWYVCATGNAVLVRHPGNPYAFATFYMHLKKDSITVHPGDAVKRGQKIGQLGSSGKSAGPHLHFEVWSDWNAPTDPWTSGCDPPWTVWQYNKTD